MFLKIFCIKYVIRKGYCTIYKGKDIIYNNNCNVENTMTKKKTN